MIISHKIELKPNNKAKTHFQKAFGCSRLAYNWGLSKWKEYYEKGIKVSYLDLKKGKISYPQYKRKREDAGSYYIGGDQVVLTDKPSISKKLNIQSKEKRYLKVPNLGYVKMTEALRFDGKINSVTISRKADRYFASFSVEITEEEFRRTHKEDKNNKSGVGIDVGLNSFVTMSNGIEVKAPKPLNEKERLLIKKSRQLSKKIHPKTKGDKTPKSCNYLKESQNLAKIHCQISNIREDFLQKLSTAIVTHNGFIAIEDLNVSGMIKNHRLAKSINDVSLYDFRRMLENKSKNYKKQIIYADRFYASSQICSNCGYKQKMPLSKRIYQCPQCNMKIDRDYNASKNLFNLIEKQIGQVLPKYTPADLTAMQECLAINNLVTSKVETGIQHKF